MYSCMRIYVYVDVYIWIHLRFRSNELVTKHRLLKDSMRNESLAATPTTTDYLAVEVTTASVYAQWLRRLGSESRALSISS